MMKLILKILGTLVALAVVVVAAGAIMLATFDPNEHKDRIAAVVKEKTGRTLTMAGDISVMYFPVLGFKAEQVRLSNPEGFGNKDFLNVATVSAGVKVLPLLKREIKLSKIILWEPYIDIVKQADGRTNLSFETQEAADQQQAQATREFTIEAVEISDGKVTYNDKASGKTYTIEPVNLSLPGYAPGEDMDFALATTIRQGEFPAAIETDIRATVNADPQSGMYNFHNIDGEIRLVSSAKGGTETSQEIVIAVAADAAADLKTEEISVSDLVINWPGSSVEGQLTAKGFSQPAVNFSLISPSLNLDALTANGGGDSQPEEEGGTGNGIFPVEAMRDLKVDGTVAIQDLRVAGVKASDVAAKIAGEKGVITVGDLRAKAYGGIGHAQMQIDVRSSVPGLRLAGGVENVQAGQLIRELKGEEYVSGLVSMDYELTAAGNTVRAWKETAGGTVGMNFTEGSINKWRLSFLINQAIAFFESGRPVEDVSDRFQFTSLTGRFIGSDGVFRNDDLVLLAPESHGLGSGYVSLRDSAVDYTLRVGRGGDASAFEGSRHLPVRISGPLAKPAYSIDFQAIAADALQEKIEEKGQDLVDKLREELGGEEPAAGDEQTDGSSSPEEGGAVDFLNKMLDRSSDEKAEPQ